jgi:hypothetical protein
VRHLRASGAEFVARTQEALDLIRRHDPRRFRRIQSRLRYIVNKELFSGGEYDRRLHACHIDFERLDFAANHEWCLLWYASALVHEATHGVIASKGVPYDDNTRARIERLCHTEEKRFVLRARPRALNDIVGEFDETQWSEYWNGGGFWTYVKRMRERLKMNDQQAV